MTSFSNEDLYEKLQTLSLKELREVLDAIRCFDELLLARYQDSPDSNDERLEEWIRRMSERDADREAFFAWREKRELDIRGGGK